MQTSYAAVVECVVCKIRDSTRQTFSMEAGGCWQQADGDERTDARIDNRTIALSAPSAFFLILLNNLILPSARETD